jgi:glucose/arabinose dehydrogenase
MMIRSRQIAGLVTALLLLGALAAWLLDSYGPQLLALARNVTLYDRTKVKFGLVEGATLEFGTSIQVGADGRIYVTDQAGHIYAYTMEQGSFESIVAVASERIDIIRDLPNHDDDGTLNPDLADRLITGMLAVGTADRPAFFISSSDPRTYRRRADSNSGVVSLMHYEDDVWHRRDLVCGLPRSHADHATNGLYFDDPNRTLFVLQGGNTNAGAPSERLRDLPEYALSGALLQIDLDRLSDECYDLPTLDDPERAGSDDQNDPYGGARGNNQARLDPAGPVTIYASGLRNPYRIVPLGDGFLTIDNGADQFFGGPPIWEGDQVTNQVSFEDGERLPSPLLLVNRGGYYGHPNPTRADRRNTFAGQSPVEVETPGDAEFVLPRGRQGLLALFSNSVNGLAWYPKAAGLESWRGKLVVVGFDRCVRLLDLDHNGQIIGSDILVRQAASTPLDVAVSPAGHLFGGTIWIVDYASGRVMFVQPVDPSPGVVDYLSAVWRGGFSTLSQAVHWYYGVDSHSATMILP